MKLSQDGKETLLGIAVIVWFIILGPIMLKAKFELLAIAWVVPTMILTIYLVVETFRRGRH